MSIRSRLGDFLFDFLFPSKAAVLEAAEDQLVDAALACERARIATAEVANALYHFRATIDALPVNLTAPQGDPRQSGLFDAHHPDA
jgi:hypothetical protein